MNQRTFQERHGFFGIFSIPVSGGRQFNQTGTASGESNEYA